jgi:exonuclease SbcD
VTVANKPSLERIETKGGPVQVVGVPWVLRSFLMAKEEYRGLTAEQLNEQIEARLGRIVEGLAAQVDDDLPAVLALHGTVAGAVYGSERSVMLGQDVVFSRSLLANPKFDYVALGHIHKHQALPTGEGQPPMVYAGSIERIDFGEAQEPKGFVVAEIEDGPARWHFHEVPTRRFVTIVVDTRQSDEPLEDVRRAIARHEIEGAVVKLIVKTTPEAAGGLRDRDLRELLERAEYVAAIVREVERPARLRLGDQETVAGMSPRELLERYLEIKQVPPERARVLLEHAELLWEE